MRFADGGGGNSSPALLRNDPLAGGQSTARTRRRAGKASCNRPRHVAGFGSSLQPCTRAKFRTDSILPRTLVAVSGFRFQIGSRICIRCAVVMSFTGKLPIIGAAYVASVFRTCCRCLEFRQAGSLPAINRSAASANVVRRTGSADCAAPVPRAAGPMGLCPAPATSAHPMPDHGPLKA